MNLWTRGFHLKSFSVLTFALLPILWIGLIYIETNILFFVNVPLSQLNALVLFGFALVFSYFYFKIYGKNCLWEMLVVLVGCALLFFFASFFYDYSYDGQMYHLTAITRIANGWNPVYQHFKETEGLEYVYNHFAKAGWIDGGFLYQLTGNVNAIKGINSVWALSTLCLAYVFFRSLDTSKWLSLLVGGILAFNPVFLNMYLSNMIDYQLGACITVGSLLLLLYMRERSSMFLTPLVLVVVYFMNLKVTALVYVCVFGLVFVLYLAYNYWKQRDSYSPKRLKTIACTSIIAFILGLCVFGYHTYVRNYTIHNHIFYPIYGADDSLTRNSPMVDAMEYRTGNRFCNIAKSVFAKSAFSESYTKPLQYKFPLMVERKELERFAFSGVMVGGFGVWYSAVFLMSLGILIWFFCFAKDNRLLQFKTEIAFLLSAYALSVYVNPLWYIARYTPQHYIICVAALYIAYYFRKKIAFYILLFLMVVNLGLIMGYTYYNVVVTQRRTEQFAEMRAHNGKVLVNFKDHQGNRAVFQQEKILFREVKDYGGKVPDTFFRSSAVYLMEN